MGDENEKERRQLVVEQNEFAPNVHAGSHRALIIGKGSGADIVAIERGDDCVGGAFGGFHCDADAGGEYWIHETRGVAQEQPTVAGETVHYVAVVSFASEFVKWASVGHAASQDWMAGDVAVEELLHGFPAVLEICTLPHHPTQNNPFL